MDIDEFEERIPRRSLRLVLTEINETSVVPNDGTPNKSTSPDEMIIIQRGPRKKPLTWSPLEYNRSKILAPPREKTPEPVVHRHKCEINPRLRRRLVLSPGKIPSQDLGILIAKKLKALKNLEQT
ncbi:hypothetical protein JTB14_038147 [Gonioctena quinquepunctata]|nr:hypothetical protein JTB14_038147 [Gonioctena quinquepunctata]